MDLSISENLKEREALIYFYIISIQMHREPLSGGTALPAEALCHLLTLPLYLYMVQQFLNKMSLRVLIPIALQ
jgi:hypothetical protein